MINHMIMKRIIVLFFALFTISAASAQTFIGLVKDAATEVVDKVTGGKVTEIMLNGTWEYDSPSVRFVKDGDILASAASTLVTEGLESRLTKAYSYIGIKEDAASFTFNDDDTFTAVLGKRTLNGTYTYDSATHQLVLEFSSILKLGKLNGYAYIDGEELDLVFDCTKFMNFLTKLGSKSSLLKGVTAITDKYDSMMVGFEFER